jgi:DNA-binding response OmpR family regulator
MNVFIVDDNMPVAFMLSEWLRDAGHTADFENNPNIVLNKARSGDLDNYDYILLDLLLNGINGMDIFFALKERNIKGKIVVVSGCDPQTEIFKKALKENIPIVIKSFSPQELVHHLEMNTVEDWCAKTFDYK